MIKVAWGLAAIGTLLAGATAPVVAQTGDQLIAAVRSRHCPADLREYNEISYKEHCGANYDTALSNMDAVLCQQETDHLNSQIYKYNDFVRQCRQASSRRSQGSRIGNGAPPRTTGSSAASLNQQQLQQQSTQPRTFAPTDNLVAPGQNKSFDAYASDQWACQNAATGRSQHEFDVSYAQCMVNRGNQSPLATPNVPATLPRPSTPSSRSPSPDLSRLIEEQRSKAIGADEQRRQAEQLFNSIDEPKRLERQQAEHLEALRRQNEANQVMIRRQIREDQRQEAQQEMEDEGGAAAAAFLQGLAGTLASGGNGGSSYGSAPAPSYRPSYTTPTPRPTSTNCGYRACTTR